MKTSQPSIEIVTPAPAGSLHGNRITALRWQNFIKQFGYRSRVSQSWSGKNTDLLIALHGYRSYPSIAEFKKQFPHKPVILVATGTDIYRDMAIHPEVLKSMQLANQIVLLQAASFDAIPKKFHFKTSVIYQSTKGLSKKSPPKREFLISVIGHLRPEKDPFCIARSLPLLPTSSKVKVQHYGMAMSPQMNKLASQYTARLPRYQWLGKKTHAATMQALSRSHLMVITSLMEGGAHVVTEAIAIGIPIIASSIPGNRGLLGDDYPGYYPVGNEKALAALISQAETDPAFYKTLEKSVRARRKLVQPHYEMRSLKTLLRTTIKNASPED